jgi:poly-gamma-glutamate synthesis protein (capsule biosynthesis protein)
MSYARPLLIIILICVAFPVSAQEKQNDIRLLFTGDILLSRNVSIEIEATNQNPWQNLAPLFRKADWVAGNLEGAVGSGDLCLPSTASNPCFAISPGQVKLLSQAGFHALANENNHANDLGEIGRFATAEALSREGIQPMTFQGSPYFFNVRDTVFSFVVVSLVPDKASRRLLIPSPDILQKLRLARALSHIVIVSVHWGSELLEWPDVSQRRAASWLIDNGADVILGHHPHVVQSAECLKGHPVFFSLGNHLFDQKYPATKEGLIADCRIGQETVRCGTIRTETAPGTSFPELSHETVDKSSNMEVCSMPLHEPLILSDLCLAAKLETQVDRGEFLKRRLYGIQDGKTRWRSEMIPLVSMERLPLKDGEGNLILTLEKHYSSIDGEIGPRPHVYEVTEKGLVARWHGSALAWPLLDAFVLPGGDGFLCALHRGDSFLSLNPNTESVRVAAYRWNGFGFSGIEDIDVLKGCRSYYEHAGLTQNRRESEPQL